MPNFFDPKRCFDNNGYDLEPFLNSLENETNLETCLDLGAVYRSGDGAPFNPIAAANWFLKAASLGSEKGAILLGLLLLDGLDDPENGNSLDADLMEGLRWLIYAESITQDPIVSNLIALTYLYKVHDSEKGVKWLRKAASGGHAQSALKLGYLYGYGEGVPKDIAESKKWFKLAADADDKEGVFMTGRLMVQSGITDKDAKAALSYFIRAAKLGHPLAGLMLGQAYFHGIGVQKSNKRAYAWFWLAHTQADLPSKEGQYVSEVLDSLEKNLSSSDIDEAVNMAQRFREEA